MGSEATGVWVPRWVVALVMRAVYAAEEPGESDTDPCVAVEQVGDRNEVRPPSLSG